MILKRFKHCLFILCSFLVLVAGFYWNFWQSASSGWFDRFQSDSESLVVGRLALAERENIFASGGLTGRYVKNLPEGKDQYLYQYEIYLDGLVVPDSNFVTYNSQIGGQALLFSVVDKLSDFTNIVNLQLFRLCTAIATALIFALFLLWVNLNFGLVSALITLLLIVQSQWITVFGRNIWWSLWSFYLPFIVLLYFLDNENQKSTPLIKLRTLFTLSFLSVLVKCVFTGYEFITTTLIMLLAPFCYYSVLNNWRVVLLGKRVLITAGGALGAVLLSFIVLAFQIATVKGSFLDGGRHIVRSYFKRTSANPDEYVEMYRQSLESTIPEVLGKYWNGIAFDLRRFASGSFWDSFLIIDFGEFFLIVIAASFLSFASFKSSTTLVDNREKSIALAVTCLFSFLAPLSWFVLFKAHSFIHVHMNFIVWYMPLLLFGFVLIGNVCGALLSGVYRFGMAKACLTR